jgi:hypothetical protein
MHRRRRGTRVLSAEMVERMHTVSHDMGRGESAAVGLGLLLIPFGDTTVLSMSGASPGGVAVLAPSCASSTSCSRPSAERAAVAGPARRAAVWLIRQHVPVTFPPLTRPKTNLTGTPGTYRSHQLRVDVRVVDASWRSR